MVNKAYVLDRYTNKNVLINNINDDTFATLKAGDKIVYTSVDQT
ncbi:MAG: hypothetical protein WCJ45_02595 [bacterium]